MSIKRKRIIIIASGIVLLAAIIGAFLLFMNRNDEYRTIQIYKIEGSARVDRDGVGSIDAYDGMMMQSGDTVYTDKESCLYFKMDEDKFALLEPESTVHMETSGTSTDSRTTFYLESGALVSRLDNKLSPDSVYEVNTPNSTMAVRGTVFRIEVTYDERGVSYTNVDVFDGTVECRLIFSDGSIDEEGKLVQSGVIVRIRGDNTVSEYILDNGIVDYEKLPVEVLEFLKAAIEEGIELPISKEEVEKILAEVENGAHEHSGGIEIRNKTDATCSKPGYTGDIYCLDCGAMLSAGSEIKIDAENHVGGTENRGAVEGTCQTSGYSGDTYCLGCGAILQNGYDTGKNPDNHVGGTDIINSVIGTCASPGYTGDTYCFGCGEIIQHGSSTGLDASNHVGGTDIRNSVAADCCNAGYTGDTYCLGCDSIIEAGTVIEATGNHPAAGCGVNGHHAHDGKTHAIASCGTKGHCISDGRNHDIAPCHFAGHRNCDGKTHGKNCLETDSAYFTIEVIVIDNGEKWNFTFNNTVYKKDSSLQDGDGNQCYYYFYGNVGDTITFSRKGTTGDFYAISEVMRVDGTETNSLSFTLKEGEQDYIITVFIS